MEKMWFVYILECMNGTYYTGVTNDIDARMEKHASGRGSKYVNKNGFRKLLFAKPCEDRSHACKCECEIKALHRHQKLDWFRD